MNQLLFRPPLEQNESLRGYILRLADRNASPSMLGALARSFSSATKAAKFISDVSGCNQEQLLARNSKNQDKNLQNLGCRFGEACIQNSQVFHTERLVCPLCISKDGISKCLWELRYYDVCHHHGCFLLSHCRACGQVLKWSYSSSEKCACGAYFSTFKAKRAPNTRKTLCTMMSNSMEKSLGRSNNDQTDSLNRALPIDWFFVLLTFINSVLIPSFWKEHLSESIILNQEHCEKLAISILNDQNYCDHIHRTLENYAENDPFVLMKIFRRLRTYEAINEYLLPCMGEITFHHSLLRLKTDKSLYKKSEKIQKNIEDGCKYLRQLEINPGNIYGSERSRSRQKIECVEILEQ